MPSKVWDQITPLLLHKLPWIFPGATFMFNQSSGNTQGNLTGMFVAVVEETHINALSSQLLKVDATALISHWAILIAE